jgi:predicted enzyme related to lactoylglutathione lyase
MVAPIVFFDIAGPDPVAQKNFFAGVLGWDAGTGGKLNIPCAGGTLEGLLRTDPAEKLIYFGVDDVTASLVKVERHGGKITAPRFEVPGVVVLGLFTDPAGNRFGLVELDNGEPKIP